MDNGNLDNIVFVLLFSADEPLTLRKISSILEDKPAAEIRASIENWRQKLDDEAWSIVVEKVAGGYQLSSRADYAPYIAKLYSGRRKMRLSKAALEALAIIAYKQPITRAEIENVRGVACGGVVTNLMERDLIKITGKAKVLGAPFLYGTTQEFLEYLGLNSLKDLPNMEELEALLEREESAVAGTVATDENGDLESQLADAVDEDLVHVEEALEPVDEEPSLDSNELAPVDRETVTDHRANVDEVKEETQAASSAAIIGPAVEEPYHRPLGGEKDKPLRVQIEERDRAVETVINPETEENNSENKNE
jgi:segregation and condensation protein B